MVIGGLPLVIISILNHDNAVSGSLVEFTANDTLALLYTSIFGSAISYGIYFYSATKGLFYVFIIFYLFIILPNSFDSFNFITRKEDSTN